MKKKNFFAPSQMIILTGNVGEVSGGGSGDGLKAGANLQEDELGDLLVPGDESPTVGFADGDIVLPDDSDEAYIIAVPES